MNQPEHLGAAARTIIDAHVYMVLGTADGDGHPWASPVFFAHKDYRDFYWISSPDVTHSTNLAARPELGIVIFNSKQIPGSGEGVYMSAVAEQLSGADLEPGLKIYPGAPERGGRTIAPDEVTAPGTYRLYRATASQHYMLCPRETGQPCTVHGRFGDHRVEVYP